MAFHHGYLPYDKTGDWLYHFVEFTGLMLACLSILLASARPGTGGASQDVFGEHPPIPPGLGHLLLIGPCFLLSLLIHPQLNDSRLSDISWAFSMYLETTALLPQLYLLQRVRKIHAPAHSSLCARVLTPNPQPSQHKSASLHLGHFIVALTFARVWDFVFWAASYHELVTSTGSRLPGFVAMAFQVGHAVLLVDFFYYYGMAVKGGEDMILPMSGGDLGV